MFRRWFIGVLSTVVIALLASVLLAKPGVLTTNQGAKFTGDITEDDQYYYVNGAGGQIKVDKRNCTVQYTQTIDDQYVTRHAKLGEKDVKGRIELAQWANQNGRADLAVAALTEARTIDPFNKEAATALDSAQKQLDLDEQSKTKEKKAPPATEPVKGGTAATPGATTAPAAAAEAPPLERRLLNADEINIIKQKEMKPDDAKIRVKFENGLVKKYLASGNKDAAAFNKLSPQGQALQILTDGDASMFKDVHILTDPTPIAEFKTKVWPLVVSGCGSTSCHGGMKAGSLAFFPGDTTAAVYTNFYICQTYAASVDGTKYQLMDRDVPKRSLVLQFGLPQSMGVPPHPKVTNYRPRFKNDTDPAYAVISDWLTNELQLPQPDYGIKVGAKVMGTSQPAAAAVPVAPMPAGK
jgi:hypothetical protein